MLDVIKTQMQASLDVLAEDMTYNGAAIKGIPEIGSSLENAPNYDMQALADIAQFEISKKYIEKPVPGDKIVYNGVTYNVVNTSLDDSLAGMWLVYVVANVRGFGRA